MKITPTSIAGVSLIGTEPFIDSRGSFARLFCAKELAPLLGSRAIAQVNHSRTIRAGAIRGLHFQRAPHGEMKFVRCLHGRVWDVAVDLRKGSPTFLNWHAEVLSAENRNMLVIPEGCAHGFQALEPGSELLYLHTGYYEPAAEGGVSHADPMLNINWPLPVSDLSPRDAAHPPLGSDFEGL